MEFVRKKIRDTKELTRQSTQQKIDELIHYENQLNLSLDKLERVVSRMNRKLEGEYLTIVDCRFRKGGGGNEGVWTKFGYLQVFLSLAPTSDEFKFFKFNGYLASGRNRNYEKMNRRAHELAEILKVKGVSHIEVNPFSLEYESANDDKWVLVEFSIKP